MDIYPVMGNYNPENYHPVSLSGLNFQNEADVQEGLADYLEKERKSNKNVKFLYGGYLEKRNFYTSSYLFKNDFENRNVHLGVDVWAEADTAVYASMDGIIHSFAYNDLNLDYGATIIIQYENYYVLYGHLSRKSLLGLYPGKPVYKSEQIAGLGDITENGGWVPHLHIQIIRDIADYSGDYPGLCSEENIELFKNNCPDPTFLVKGEK